MGLLKYVKHLKNLDIGDIELLTSKDLFTNDENIKPKHLLSLNNVEIAYGGSFWREPSIAHNIGGIRITNSKKM